MIQYSSRARVGYARLFGPYNDIDIFVEDSSYSGLYERLINRILDGRGKVTKVTPLGPRSEVEQRALQDIGPHNKPRLYIVDGDLDLIAASRQKKIPNLYRLKVYSLENLLFEDDAIKEYCEFASPSLPAGACEASVGLQDLSDQLNRTILPYIVSLSIARRLKLRHATYALNPPSIAHIVGGRAIGPCPNKVRIRTRAIVGQIVSEKGHAKFREAKRVVLNNIRRRSLTGVKMVPAKDFGLPYLNKRVEACGGMGMNQRAISSYLARHIKFENDKSLTSTLRKLVR